MADLPKKPETIVPPASPSKAGSGTRSAPESPNKRRGSAGNQTGGNRGGRSNNPHSRSPSKAKAPMAVGTASGSETSMHAPQGLGRSGSGHRKNQSSGASTSPTAELKSLPLASGQNAQAGSTLNPNAGGFQPGGLSALTEVQNEVLVSE